MFRYSLGEDKKMSESGLCKCGCGEKVKPGNKYVHGHNRRGLASFTANGRWSVNYGACLGCGTTKKRHQRDGYCSSCARKKLYSGEWGSKRDLTEGRWAKEYQCCAGCGTVERPHQAHGLCGRCWQEKINREMGRPKRNFGGWSWYSDECRVCGSSDKPHVGNGMCYDCFYTNKRKDKYGEGVEFGICPICGAKVVKMWQHVSMKSKRCSKHKDYYNRFYNDILDYFDTDKTSKEVSEITKVSKRRVLSIWHENFTDKEIKERGERIRISKISGENNYLYGKPAPLISNNLIDFVDFNGRVFVMRSTWEVEYAKYLDKEEIRWEYESKKFKYYDVNGFSHYYFPDFYLPDYDKFVEIKGFMDEKSEYKISECCKLYGIKIDVLEKEDLFSLGLLI